MFLKKFSKKLIILILIFVLFGSLILPGSIGNISARTEEEIQDEINEKNDELSKTQDDLQKALKDLESKESDLSSAGSELGKIMAEISKLEAEKKVNELKLKELEQQKKLKELERDKKIASQAQNVKTSYMDWRARNPFTETVMELKDNPDKTEQYTAFLLDDENSKLIGIVQTLDSLDEDISEYSELLDKIKEANSKLEARKKELEEQYNKYNSIYASSQSNVNGLLSKKEALDRSIANLTSEQQQAANIENDILENSPPPVPPTTPPEDPTPPDNGGTPPTQSGNFRFSGTGRDLYQGHGVGLSQWGAYGMAGSHGWSYNNILNFYYTGVSIPSGYEGTVLNVEGYGNMNIEDYIAGLGEVPSKACGNSTQASQNPSKYVLDNPNTVWDCWPEHAIKAQVVAARTYAIRYANSHGGSICTTAVCQVYSGGDSKRWASNETKGMVITSGGALIDAVYSADNNQGAGTADNDTIWQNFAGNGSPASYLRAKNDNAYAAYTQWTHWGYSTGVYNFSSIDQLLNYGAGSSSPYAQGTKNEISAIKSAIGNVNGLTFERDGSGRVKKVWLQGTSGQSRSIGGWWFKNLWNSWVYDRGTYDYLYSQSFNLVNQ